MFSLRPGRARTGDRPDRSFSFTIPWRETERRKAGFICEVILRAEEKSIHEPQTTAARHQTWTDTKPTPAVKTGTLVVPPGDANLLGAGLKHHQAGRLAEAEACYRRVLAAQPDHADALHLLGVVAHQAGRHDLAVELISQAIKQNGQNAAYFCSLGIALKNQGKLDEAVTAYRQAIRIKPDLAEAHSNLGNALRGQGKLDEAVAACRQAIRVKPDLAEGPFQPWQCTDASQSELEEALASYDQAL